MLLGKGLTVLQIRDFLSGEFTPLPLADVMAVLKAREAAGAIKLVPAIRDVLERAIEAGGSTLRDYRHADGGPAGTVRELVVERARGCGRSWSCRRRARR